MEKLCWQWAKKPDLNPWTERSIQPGKRVAKTIRRRCWPRAKPALKCALWRVHKPTNPATNRKLPPKARKKLETGCKSKKPKKSKGEKEARARRLALVAAKKEREKTYTQTEMKKAVEAANRAMQAAKEMERLYAVKQSESVVLAEPSRIDTVALSAREVQRLMDEWAPLRKRDIASQTAQRDLHLVEEEENMEPRQIRFLEIMHDWNGASADYMDYYRNLINNDVPMIRELESEIPDLVERAKDLRRLAPRFARTFAEDAVLYRGVNAKETRKSWENIFSNWTSDPVIAMDFTSFADAEENGENDEKQEDADCCLLLLHVPKGTPFIGPEYGLRKELQYVLFHGTFAAIAPPVVVRQRFKVFSFGNQRKVVVRQYAFRPSAHPFQSIPI